MRGSGTGWHKSIMNFLTILKANPRRGLLLAVAAIGLMAILVGYDQGLTPWAWARTADPFRSAHSFVQSEASFQTLSDFVNRSPGERGEIDVTKGSSEIGLLHQGDRLSPIPRSQRALGKVFEPEPFTTDLAQQGPIELLTTPMADISAPTGLLPIDPMISASSGNGAIANTIPGSIILGPSGTSSSGGGQGGNNPRPPPLAAVPEPSTWALLLIGFFGTGFVLRRGMAKKQDRLKPVNA